MSATSTSVFNALSMTDSGLFSISSAFAAKSPFTTLSIPARAAKLHLSCAHSSSLSPSLSLKKKPQFPSIFTRAAEEESTITLEQEEGSEVQVSDWEGNGGDSAGEEPIGVAEEAADAEPSEDAKIFVANIHYDVDSEQLATLFQNVGQVEVAEIVYNRETDRSRGFGFVTMSTVEEAENAIEKFNRYEWDGRVLVVNKASKRGERIERPPRTFAPAFKIFVANMSWDMDDSRLEQIFSEHGQVQNARVVLDRETGRSRGFGFVTMSSETEMNNAIAALDGQTLDGRSIRVTVAEQRPRRS